MLINFNFSALITIDVFLLMFPYVLIFLTAMILRVKEPDAPRSFRVPLPTWVLGVWVAFPIAIAVIALFVNGMDWMIGGLAGVLTGPIAYLVFKNIYKGTTDEALEGSTITSARRAHRVRRRGGRSRSMKGQRMAVYAAVAGVLAGLAAIGGGLYAHSAAAHVRHPGVLRRSTGTTSPASTCWSASASSWSSAACISLKWPSVGAIIVCAAAMLGLIYTYDRGQYRWMPLVYYWWGPWLLAWIAGIFAGYAAYKNVPQSGEKLADARHAEGRSTVARLRRRRLARRAPQGCRRRPPDAAPVGRSRVLGLQQDRHRPVVDQLDVHVGAEDAGLDRHALGAQRLDERLVDRLAVLGRRGVGEARPVALAGVGVERELRDGQHLAADVGERQVHEARRRPRRRAAWPSWRRACSRSRPCRSWVTPTRTRKPRPIAATRCVAHGHRGAAHALDEDAHGRSLRAGIGADGALGRALPPPPCQRALRRGRLYEEYVQTGVFRHEPSLADAGRRATV